MRNHDNCLIFINQFDFSLYCFIGAPNALTCEFFEYKESGIVYIIDYSPLIFSVCISILSSMFGLYVDYSRESSLPTLSDNDSSNEMGGFLSPVG